ncbi:RodZ domain-containing protein [Alteromonas sp. ASW11-130]|uniref:RodZ domain-containing protein n=1 Tax=Alteromonas sp. ASW11-130 TaxID=3015775 RepID=UPI0022429D3E|nr:RodZ domain-containing protein [Alteromonas sp. ASW11-130]MCW8091348.1 DUF4115 domain-containing protein [Alteromonas sp. ASW11-130]
MEIEEQQEQDKPSRPSPGMMLKSAREQQGLSQQDIADKLFIKPQSVDDIENDKVDPRISITFTKGYVKMYAKHVGLDDKAVIAEFEKLHAAPAPQAHFQSFSKKVNKQAHDDRWMMVTYVILFLIIAGVVGWWYQQSNDDSLIEDANQTLSVPPTDSEETFQQIPINEDTFNRQSDTLQNSTEQSIEAAQDNTTQITQDRFPLPDEKESENSNVDVADRQDNPRQNSGVTEDDSKELAEQTETGKTASLEFTFGEDCWVNIKDSTGEAIAYGVKDAGRVMTVNGIPPFDITLGAPDEVSIRYNGEPVDISFYQNGRTARIKLPY